MLEIAMKKEAKKPVKKARLTVPLYVPISPKLKDAIDLKAFNDGMTTNEWVALVCAEKLGNIELAKIPRHRLGRRPQSVAG